MTISNLPHVSGVAHRPQGIIVPLVTPFDEAGDIDLAANARLVRRVIDGGVHALFVVGTTGEGPSLSAREQRALIRDTCVHAGEVPVYAGVTHTSVRETLDLIDAARDFGVKAAVAAPSPYFPVGVKEQVAYFAALAEKSSLPLLIYNIPQLTKTPISLEAFRELVDHPRIIGIKDSSGLVVYFRRLQHVAAKRPDFSLLIGADELLAEAVLLGADGGVTGGANLAPRLFCRLYSAARRGDLTEVRRLHAYVMQLSCSLYSAENGAYVIQGIKEVLHRAGVCGPAMRLPLLPAAAGIRALVDQTDKLLAEVSVSLLESASVA